MADGLIELSRQEEPESEYTVKKGRKIGNKVSRVTMGRQGTHLARRVFGKGTTQWNIAHKQVMIEWDTNHQVEWVNESQIKRCVNKEGKGDAKRKS